MIPTSDINNLNKYINHNFFDIVQWLRTNRLSLNKGKIEIILFQPKGKNITKNLNFRINWQKINLVKQTKDLGIYLDENLTWNFQINQFKSKLSRDCGLFTKLTMLKQISSDCYFTIFDSILRYGVKICGQHRSQKN